MFLLPDGGISRIFLEQARAVYLLFYFTRMSYIRNFVDIVSNLKLNNLTPVFAVCFVFCFLFFFVLVWFCVVSILSC